MPIEFTCNGCNNTLRVPDEHAGKQARCPRCQTLNLIQAAAPSDEIPYAITESSAQHPPKPQSPFSASEGVGAAASAAGAANPYRPTVSSRHYAAHRGTLILILGILSIACNLFFIPGIMAWVMGKADLKSMDAGTMDPEGRGLTTAGMIIGMVMTIIAIIGVVLYLGLVFLLVVAAAAG